jgi:hypothetical protein
MLLPAFLGELMPRFYVHLSATDEDFRDEIGCELVDLSAAHFRDRVIMLSAFSNYVTDFRRWTVRVTDDRKNAVLTVIFPSSQSAQRGISFRPKT